MSDSEFRDPGQPYGQQPYGGPPPTGPYDPAGGQPGGQGGYLPPPGNPYGYQPPYPYQGQPYGYPAPPGSQRPGTLTAAAVLGYVTGGLLILAAIFVFAGASVADEIEDASGSATSFDGEFVVAGLLNLLAAGLFIGGSVAMSGRSPTGRALYAIAAGLTVLGSLYWGIRFGVRYDGLVALLVYALLFAALAIVGVSLAFTRAGSRWLAHR